MSWDEKLRAELGPEWPDFWIEIWADPPMGAWLALQEAAVEALRNPGDLKAIEAAIDAFTPLIAGHNVTDRDGKPLTLTLRSMSQGLFLAVLGACQKAMTGEAARPPLPLKAGRSRGRSSRRSGSRRASSSGASQVA